VAEHCCHHCQLLLDALEDLRVSRLIHALRPYLPSSPLPARHPAARVPRQRSQAERRAEYDIHRHRTAAPPVGTNNRGGRA